MSINANSLPNQSTMAATDRLLGFAPDTNAGFSIDYTVLAKKIIEEYTGSTVAGSAQTLQTALNAINSSLGGMAFQRFNIAASGSKTVTVGTNYSGLIIFAGGDSSIGSLYVVNATGSGILAISTISGGTSSITMSRSTGELSIESTSTSYIFGAILTIRGSAPTIS